MLHHRLKEEENSWEGEEVRAGCKVAKGGKSFDGRRL
jgi:hypothetical protein